MNAVGKAKLTDHDIYLIGLLKREREILRKRASDLKDDRLAEKFEVSRTTIERIPVCEP